MPDNHAFSLHLNGREPSACRVHSRRKPPGPPPVADVAASQMIFPQTAFRGKLGDDVQSLEIDFTASVDASGALELTLSSIPASVLSFQLGRQGRGGDAARQLRLTGVGGNGETFESGSFVGTHHVSSTRDGGGEATFRGECSHASITHTHFR
jgi:hypothetical protein